MEKEVLQPLATQAQSYEAIPGVSSWVLNTIKQGYSLQFACRPPRFMGVICTSVQSNVTNLLHSEVMNVLVKAAVETVPPAHI